jgi:hemerythrin-like domain-containing protein
MTTVVDILRMDHVNLAKLLDFIAEQALLASTGGRADLEALLEAVEYLSDYPVRFHHPLENAICERVMQVRPAARDYAERFQREHVELDARLTDFRKFVAAAREGRDVSRKDFASAVDHFVKAERRHMASEEEELFPAAMAVLRAKDWALIRERAEEGRYPLFGQAPRASLARLSQLLSE